MDPIGNKRQRPAQPLRPPEPVVTGIAVDLDRFL